MGRLGRSLVKSLNGLNESRSTWDLYKNKPLLKRIMSVLYIADILDPVFNTYYSIRGFISNVKRLIEYVPLVWQHRIWDYGFVLKFNIKLHEDLYKGCYKEGNHVFTKYQARKLQTVIGLYKRLHDDEYGSLWESYLEKRYGTNDMIFTPTEKGLSLCTFSRKVNLSKEEYAKYIKESKKIWALEAYQKKQDLTLLSKYITKYSSHWWD